MDPDHQTRARYTVILLERLWRKSGERLAARCRGLADEELLWEPVDDSWNLVPDSAHPGGWTYPYDFDPTTPPSGDEHRLAVCPRDRRQRDLYGARLRARSAHLSRSSGSWHGGRGLGGLGEQSPTRDGLVGVGQ